MGIVNDYIGFVYSDFTYSAIVSIIALVILIISIKLLFGLFKKEPKRGAILEQNEHGIIKVSLETIDSLVLKSVRQVKGVREVKTSVNIDVDGLIILLRLKVAGDTNIPETSQNIQKEVKGYVEEYSGIRVKVVNVHIENIVDNPNRIT